MTWLFFVQHSVLLILWRWTHLYRVVHELRVGIFVIGALPINWVHIIFKFYSRHFGKDRLRGANIDGRGHVRLYRMERVPHNFLGPLHIGYWVGAAKHYILRRPDTVYRLVWPVILFLTKLLELLNIWSVAFHNFCCGDHSLSVLTVWIHSIIELSPKFRSKLALSRGCWPPKELLRRFFMRLVLGLAVLGVLLP